MALAVEILLEGKGFQQLGFGALQRELTVELREIGTCTVPLLLQKDDVVGLLPIEKFLLGFAQFFFEVDDLVGDRAEGDVRLVRTHGAAVGNELVHDRVEVGLGLLRLQTLGGDGKDGGLGENVGE